MFLILTIFVNVLVFWNQALCQTCPSGEVRSINGRYYFLSNNQVNATAASDTCSSLDGYLVSFANSTVEQEARELIQEKYTSGLQDIWGFFSNNFRNTRYAKTSSVAGFGGRFGDLGKFKLYASPNADYNTPYWFCENYDNGQGMYVSNEPCLSAFQTDFTAYGGTSQSARSIVRYIYRAPNFVDRVSPDDAALRNFVTRVAPIYLPDIYVFIGARSIAGQTAWYWSNPANTATTMFGSAPLDQCRQQAIRFLYNGSAGDRWDYAGEACAGKRSYYVCEFQSVDVQANSFDCNGSSLNVSWVMGKASSEPNNDFIVQISLNNTLHATSNVTDGSLILESLQPNTNYDVKVSMRRRGCSNIEISRTIQARTETGPGIPQPVQEARVVNSTNSSNSDCVIEWEHDRSDYPNITYQIVANSSPSSTDVIQNVIDINGTSDIFNVSVDLENFQEGIRLTFQISAISCQGESIATEVVGFCNVGEPNPNGQSIVIAVCISAAGILLIGLVILVIYRRKKSSLPPDNTNHQSKATWKPRTTIVNGTSSSFAQEKKVIATVPPKPISQELKTPQIPQKRYLEPENPVYDNEMIDEVRTVTSAVSKQQLRQNYFDKTKYNYAEFAKEFKVVLKSSAQKLHNAASMTQNTKKNRYKNIYPFDKLALGVCAVGTGAIGKYLFNIVSITAHCVDDLTLYKIHCLDDDRRVVLSESEGSDYINASFIDGYHNNQRFIAAQGPKVCTIMDFWKMVWEQNTFVIVMLCNLKEKDKVKCARYWAAEKMTKTFQDYKVHTKREENLGGIVKRIIGLTDIATKKKRMITQFHLISWPDHGVPATTSNLMNLYRMVSAAASNKPNSPIVVHCSAGAGRTGTFIGMFYLFDELKETGSVDVQAAVLKMRESRKDMVQTLEQFVYIHKLLLERHIFPDTEMLASDLGFLSSSECDKRIESEFNLLSEIMNLNTNMIADEVGDQSEFDQCKPYDINIVSLKDQKDSPWPIIMNASYIESPNSYTMLIAAQSPSQEREDLFWEMVEENFVSCVVALEYQNSDSVAQTKQGDQLIFGKILIQVDEVQKHQMFTERALTLIKDEAKISLLHLHITCWKATNIPPEFSVFADIVTKITAHFGDIRGVTLIHCRNGSTRTGLLMAFMNLYERLRSQGRINVFRAAKDLRELRPKMIETLDVYQHCFVLMQKAIKHMQEYENVDDC